MKIGLIAPPWLPVPPPGYGGTEVVVDHLARGLRDAGHDVVLIATGDSSCPVDIRSCFETGQIHRIGSITAELHQTLFAYEHFGDRDLIHDHTLIGPVLAAAAGMRNVVTTNHGPFDADAREVYGRIAEKIPLLAISRHQASTAAGVRISAVIHHGLNIDRIPVGSGDGGYLLFLGRMNPDKGAHRAIAITKAAGMPLLLAGKAREPEEKQYFEAAVAPNLTDEIRYVGETSETQKFELLGGAVGLLNPIQWPEPFGLVMIEALACGTPVLVTPHGAAPELIDSGVTGFVAADEEALTGYVADLHRLDRALCRKVAEERFSTRRMVDEHLTFYRNVLDSR